MSVIKFYEPVSNAPILNRIVFLSVSIIITYLLSFAYGLIIPLFPFVYLTPLITIAFGSSMAFSLRTVAKLTLIRSDKFKKVSAGILGSIGLYFSWIAYVNYLLFAEGTENSYYDNLYLFYDFPAFIEIIGYINTEGVWEIFGIPFRGAILTIIWVIEALIIVIAPVYIVSMQKTAPFSTRLNKWYKKHTLFKEFETLPNSKEFINAQDWVEFIDNLSVGKPLRFGRISIFYLKDEDDQYLLYENIMRSSQSKGESSTVKVDYLRIPSSVAKELMTKYHAKKDFFFDY